MNHLIFLQDSFYHNLTKEQLTRVQEYNFDHPGQFNCTHQSLIISDFILY